MTPEDSPLMSSEADSRFLELRRTISLSGGPIKFLVTFYEPDKNPTRSRRQGSFGGETEASCLRQLAGALEHYGSWEAVLLAIQEASNRTEVDP